MLLKFCEKHGRFSVAKNQVKQRCGMHVNIKSPNCPIAEIVTFKKSISLVAEENITILKILIDCWQS